VTPLIIGLLAGLVGILLGALGVLAFQLSERQRRQRIEVG
jgi:two-component system sensor histidine kinase SenX3